MTFLTKYASLRKVGAALALALGISTAALVSLPAKAAVYFGVGVPAPGYYYAPAPYWGVWWGPGYYYRAHPVYHSHRWWRHSNWCARHPWRC